MEQEKITVRFESTLESANSEPILLSGPMQVFEWVDFFDDLTSKRSKVLDPNNPTLMDLIYDVRDKENEIPQIIVFVSNLAYSEDQTVNNGFENSQPHRGGYFIFTGDRYASECNASLDWKEILLGTHSHENKDQLDSLMDLPYSETSGDKILGITDKGLFTLIDFEKISDLPPLPIEAQNIIIERKRREDLERKYFDGTIESGHHLDANLKELSNSFDWLVPNKEAVYENISYGTCRDLYYAMIKAAKPLYLNQRKIDDNEYDYFISSKDTENNLNISLALETVDINPQNLVVDSTNRNRFILGTKFNLKLNDSDEIFVFADDRYISNDYYRIIERKYETGETSESIKILFFDPEIVNTTKITFLFLRKHGGLSNNFVKQNFISFLLDNVLFLNDIHNELIQLYIAGEFSKKNTLDKKYYLSINEEGNLYWDNKFLPTQYFRTGKVEVNSEYLKNPENIVERNGQKFIKLVFEKMFFSFEEHDFPMILADNYFAFDLTPDAELSGDGKNLVYLLEKGNRYFDFGDEDENTADLYDLDNNNETVFTLILIKNSASSKDGENLSGSLLNELAENYVSKEEAVRILSHGKIKLNEYAKSEALISYSKIGHIHTQYANKNHNHDYKYANFYHSHPELAALFATKLSEDITGEDVEYWVERLTEDMKSVVSNAEKTLSMGIDETKILLDDSTIKWINDKIIKDSRNNSSLLDLSDENYLNNYKENELILPLIKKGENDTLSVALDYIIRFFESDRIGVEQVKFDERFYVTNKNGFEHLESYYEKDRHLIELLRDMFNPRIPISDVIESLMPDPEFTRISWYVSKEEGVYEPIHKDSYGRTQWFNMNDTINIESWKFDDDSSLYFQIDCRNSKNEPCRFQINYNNIKKTLQSEIKDVLVEYDPEEYTDFLLINNNELEETSFYYYSKFKYIYEKVGNYKKISFVPFSKSPIYDSYGMNPTKFNAEEKIIEIQPDFKVLQIDYFATSFTLDNDDYANEFEETEAVAAEFESKLRLEPETVEKGLGNKVIRFNLHPEHTDFIVFAMRTDLFIPKLSFQFIDERLTEIQQFFIKKNTKIIKNNGYDYVLLYYKVLNPDLTIDSLKIKVKILKDIKFEEED